MCPDAVMGSSQQCPNCDDSGTRAVFSIPKATVVQCSGCGLQFARAYPDIDDADTEIYSQEYFDRPIAEKERRKRIFNELLEQVEAVAGHTGRLLDVGAGEGTLVETANERGWQAEGTEISSVMITFMREKLGLTAHQGEVENVDLPGKSFDAIVMNHVLEHVKNPGTTLARVAELLRDDGVARIEVPNIASLSTRGKNLQSRFHLKKSPWKHYSTGHHFWFFSPSTLRHTAAKAGLQVISMSAPAHQWGVTSSAHRMTNWFYEKGMLGGHLVLFARPQRQR
jgi:2-polyprenyl-3-methyl-5-hydroxy-6-metoxy-1,4-benzoquinol methylase